MDKRTLIARIRQILAADKNALALYSDLARTAEDGELKKKFADIAKDEKKHCALGEKMLLMLEK